MKVKRRIELETEDFCIGDRIVIKLKNYESVNVTATAQKVTKDGTLFLFDNAIVRMAMNSMIRSSWLNNMLLPLFPKKLQENISYITIPTYGQIFGHDDFYKNFEPDDDEQFELMKRRGNRVCYFEGDQCSWWLRNQTKKEVSSAVFAGVYCDGGPNCNLASHSVGIRPVFLLRKEK